MTTATIEAGQSVKGYRLQRLRALKVLLDSLTDDPEARVFCAVEYHGDVRIERDDGVEIEEAKDYESVRGFSFANQKVLHAVAQFVVLHLENREAPNLRFGFYTNVAIAKEIKSQRVKNLQLTLPDRSIIELLQEGAYDEDHLLPCVMLLVSRQLVDERGTDDAYVQRLSKWTKDQWVTFLTHIRWHFGERDEKQLFEALCSSIPKYPRFNSSHRGKEEHIVAALLDLLDRRQSGSPLQRLISSADVNVVFLEAAALSGRPLDPLWTLWEETQAAHMARGDTGRGVNEKFNDFLAPNSNDDGAVARLLSEWGDVAAMGHLEWSATDTDRNMQGLRLRVLKTAQKVLRESPSNGDAAALSEALATTLQAAQQEVDEYESCHDYLYTGKSSTKKMLATMLDKCYLDIRANDKR